MSDDSRNQPHILSHLTRWKDLYEIIGILLAVMISAMALLYSHKAFRVQNREFYIRNRPYITLTNPTLSGPQTMPDGQVIEHAVTFELKNLSDIPARSVKTLGSLLINDSLVSTTTISQSASLQGDARAAAFLIEPHFYSQMLDPKNKFEVRAKTTYYGMFDEKEPFQTTTIVRYYHAEKAFKASEFDLK